MIALWQSEVFEALGAFALGPLVPCSESLTSEDIQIKEPGTGASLHANSSHVLHPGHVLHRSELRASVEAEGQRRRPETRKPTIYSRHIYIWYKVIKKKQLNEYMYIHIYTHTHIYIYTT